MKLITALLSILGNTIFGALAGPIICAVWGMMICGSIWPVIGLPVAFADGDKFIWSWMMSIAAGLCLGLFGGGIAFALAGFIQSAAEQFNFKNPLGIETGFDTCLRVAHIAAGFLAVGGGLTGAVGGVSLWILGKSGSYRSWEDVYIMGAGIGGAAGYVLGLFIGALAPGAVLKLQARWREWRKGEA
jgi:hypothetical protein